MSRQIRPAMLQREKSGELQPA